MTEQQQNRAAGNARGPRIALDSREATEEGGAGIERQEAALRAYVAQHPDWQIVSAYTDAASGQRSVSSFAGLSRALDAAGREEYDVLLVQQVDRLGTRLDNVAVVLDCLKVSHVALHSATEPFDTSTATGRIVALILTVMAHEIGRLAEATSTPSSPQQPGTRGRTSATTTGTPSRRPGVTF